MRREDVNSQLMHEISALNRKVRSLFDAMVKERGLTLPRARALFSLSKKDGVNQRELAFELELETPTVVRLLDSMEEQGVVERKAEGADRRAKQVHLTELGRETAADINLVAADFRNELMAEISEADMETTLKTIRTLTAKVYAMDALRTAE